MTEIIIWFIFGLVSTVAFLAICVIADKVVTRRDVLLSILILLVGPTFLLALIVGCIIFGTAALLITMQQKLFEKCIHMPKINLDKPIWRKK